MLKTRYDSPSVSPGAICTGCRSQRSHSSLVEEPVAVKLTVKARLIGQALIYQTVLVVRRTVARTQVVAALRTLRTIRICGIPPLEENFAVEIAGRAMRVGVALLEKTGVIRRQTCTRAHIAAALLALGVVWIHGSPRRVFRVVWIIWVIWRIDRPRNVVRIGRAVRILRILGVVVVRRVRVLRLRVAVVALALLAAAVVLGLALGLAWAFLPVDILAGPVATGDQRTAATAILPLEWRITILASWTGRHRLTRIGRLLIYLVVDIGTHAVPAVGRVVLAQARVIADLAIPDDGVAALGADLVPMHGEASMEELYHLLDVCCLV